MTSTRASQDVRVHDLTLEMRRKDAVFWSILDAAGEGFITANAQGVIELFNSAAEQMFGYGPQEVMGSLTAKLFTELKPEELVEDGQKRTKGRRKDGSVFDCDLAISSLRVFDRDLVILVVRDITERLAQESQAQQSQKLESIGQLAAGIAHEINTPTQFIGDNVRFLSGAIDEVLTALRDTEQLVETLAAAPETAELVTKLAEELEELDLEFLKEELPQAVKQSIDGVDRVAGIVQAMKNFSHPGSMGFAPVDLNRAIQNTLTVSRSEWKYQAELELELEPELPTVVCAEAEINQVFLNMIVNASHAMESVRKEGDPLGCLRIATSLVGEQVQVEIQDSGCGIPDEIRERIFDPFFTTKGVGKGTGQGLSLARNTVTAHGGSIEAVDAPTSGTIFRIRLPLGGPERDEE